MLRTAPSPFGTHVSTSSGSSTSARPLVAQCNNSSHSHLRRASSSMQRQFSSTLQPQNTLQIPRQRSRCCAIAEALDLVSSASAAVSSFDDVCEAFGDIAKLDNLVARGATSAAAAVLSPPGAPVGFDLSVALSWGVEKLVGSLGSVALLEGLVDKTLIDLFQQVFSALELAGSTFDTPWLRLGVAVTLGLAVRQAVAHYQAAHSQKLQRQLSPAASLSDVIAEQAAAAVLSAAGVTQQQQQQQQQEMQRQPTWAFAGASAAATRATPASPFSSSSSTTATTSKSSSSSSSSSSGTLSSLFGAAVKSPAAVVPRAVGPAAVAGSTMLLLGQVKRANKIKKQVAAVVSEGSNGRWSPAVLMVVIEAAALVHSYSEMANGVATLLHLGA